MKYYCNAFSLNMLDCSKSYSVSVNPIVNGNSEVFAKEVRNGKMINAVGHGSTADILGVPCNRIGVSLEKGDEVVVAQYVGPRLEEGATKLPDGAKINFISILIG